MNGAGHFREAKKMLKSAETCDETREAYYLGAAQVHATLALAAATAYPAIRDWLGDEARDGADWSEAAS